MGDYLALHQDAAKNALQKSWEAGFSSWLEDLKTDQMRFATDKILKLGWDSDIFLFDKFCPLNETTKFTNCFEDLIFDSKRCCVYLGARRSTQNNVQNCCISWRTTLLSVVKNIYERVLKVFNFQ